MIRRSATSEVNPSGVDMGNASKNRLELRTRFVLTSLACIVALSVSGCASKLLEVKTNNPASYPFHQSADGLSIGLEPVTDTDRLRSLFGKNLLAEGLLPILIVVENNNPSTSFLLSKEHILLAEDKAGTAATSKRGVIAVDPPGARVAAASLLLGPAAFLMPVSDAQSRQHNLAEKELVTRTISPGGRADGFVYYQFPKGAPTPNAYRVTVQALVVGTNRTVSIALDVTLQ